MKKMIDDFLKYIPNSLYGLSGSVFYSGRNAFQGKKELYILGLNPGGSDILQGRETVEWHTRKVVERSNPNWSAYKDESWLGKPPGTHSMQPRILHLFRTLSLSPYEVPSSNLIFVRSPRERNISDKFSDYAELCWDFHKQVIEDLQIKVVLCLGQSTGKFVRRKLNANNKLDEFVENNARNWATSVYGNSSSHFVIVATHPSIADWTNKKTDPSDLVKNYLLG